MFNGLKVQYNHGRIFGMFIHCRIFVMFNGLKVQYNHGRIFGMFNG